MTISKDFGFQMPRDSKGRFRRLSTEELSQYRQSMANLAGHAKIVREGFYSRRRGGFAIGRQDVQNNYVTGSSEPLGSADAGRARAREQAQSIGDGRLSGSRKRSTVRGVDGMGVVRPVPRRGHRPLDLSQPLADAPGASGRDRISGLFGNRGSRPHVGGLWASHGGSGVPGLPSSYKARTAMNALRNPLGRVRLSGPGLLLVLMANEQQSALQELSENLADDGWRYGVHSPGLGGNAMFGPGLVRSGPERAAQGMIRAGGAMLGTVAKTAMDAISFTIRNIGSMLGSNEVVGATLMMTQYTQDAADILTGKEDSFTRMRREIRSQVLKQNELHLKQGMELNRAHRQMIDGTAREFADNVPGLRYSEISDMLSSLTANDRWTARGKLNQQHWQEIERIRSGRENMGVKE
jgi:hypothetical protein